MPDSVAQKKELVPERQPTLEEHSYIDGIWKEFLSEKVHYKQLVAQLMGLQGQVDLAEGRLRLTRDHVVRRFSDSPLLAPPHWEDEMRSVRFVGVRIGEACLTVLSEMGRATSEELADALSHGDFRFRTNSPLREVHGAMIRQQDAIREGGMWVYQGAQRPPIPMSA